MIVADHLTRATSLGMMSDEEKKHQRIEDIKALLDYEVTSH